MRAFFKKIKTCHSYSGFKQIHFCELRRGWKLLTARYLIFTKIINYFMHLKGTVLKIYSVLLDIVIINPTLGMKEV